ncbi:hypothetical protein [Halorarius halobius]|uniref:hypothetical protein n=1 Tax=Halorarius halobius TaxID=2962671 RepID=UPI0020CC43CD|nr:hypothetical protein [Halorarius halobius]
MAQMPQRRTILKAAGAASTFSLAGCVGSGGNGESGGSENTVKISLAPSGFQGIVMDHIHSDTDILKNTLSEYGYSPEVKKSWEGSAMFAAGRPDFETMGSLEAARLAANRDLDLTVAANLAPNFVSWWTKKGSPYDPANTGSAKATVDKLAQEGDKFALGSWSTGDVPAYKILMGAEYGYDFGQDKSDFNIVTADLFAIPQLLVDEEIAVGTSSPIHGGAPFLADEPEIVPIWPSVGDKLAEVGFARPQLNGWLTTQEYYSNQPDAVKGLVQAWYKGLEWFFDNPKEIVVSNDQHLQQLGVETKKQAKYIVDWGINLEYGNKSPIIYNDIELTDEFISGDKKFLARAAEQGLIPSSWDEHLEYQKVPQE